MATIPLDRLVGLSVASGMSDGSMTTKLVAVPACAAQLTVNTKVLGSESKLLLEVLDLDGFCEQRLHEVREVDSDAFVVCERIAAHAVGASVRIRFHLFGATTQLFAFQITRSDTC